MSKHHLVPNLIGACKQRQYLITFICLLTLIVGSQNVYPQQQIALDTYAIFQQSCLICHGPDGAYKETLLIEHNALIQNGTVVPGNPDASELYKRLITTETAKRMPLLQPQLPAQSINTIRNWILAGAPDWAVTSTTDGDSISPAEILTTVETHLMSLAPFDRAFARYFTMTHLYNAGETAQILQEYRKGLSKLVNSLSWKVTVTNPHPIDPQGTIFYIDLRHYEWDVNDAWGQIEAAYPYHISFEAPTQTALRDQLGRLQGEMKSSIPSVHIDWFLANASLPPLYHELLSLPLTDRELETRLEVDVVRNLNNAPGIDVWRAGFNNSGVSNNNRMVERHASRYGAYWKSYDFAGSVGTQNIFTHPLDFTHDGGEVIFNLPNGLQGYYLVNATGFRLDDAPINIVSNPAASDPTVRNGISCFGCHTEGMKTFEDEVRAVIQSNAALVPIKEQALRLYVEQSEMAALVKEDMDRYRVALEATGGTVDDIEPIQRFHEVFQGPVDATYAAAVVGLEIEAFLEKIRENIGLQNIGLLALDGENGSMKRDAWTSSFRDIIFALNFPERFKPPIVITPPVTVPGAVVQIPDPNLRAVIAEALGKSPNAPITAQEMQRLRKIDARKDRSIKDLTGLQYATNLVELYLGWYSGEGNQVSDLSPVAGLTNLRVLFLHHNPISDLSPVRGLMNLTDLMLYDTLVSDISPVRGLTNLTKLHFHGTEVTDLSPISGLINLKDLAFSDPDLSDISPVAGLINLETIFSWNHSISDLSALSGLTKLRTIDLCGGDISDLTPIAGLTGLKKLYFVNNEISDISPLVRLTGLTHLNLAGNEVQDISSLAGLTNLEWLNASINQISDVSPILGLTNLTWLNVARNQIADLAPLQGLREKITLIWLGNPAIPKEGGPKIEGPWLWVVFPDAESDFDNGTDLLSKASDGTVTEAEIATHGATEGKSVGDAVWTSHSLPPTGNNISDMLRRPSYGSVIYGTVSLHLPREQKTTMYVGNNDGLKVWLNGVLIYEVFGDFGKVDDYNDFSPVTLQPGVNVLLVAVLTRSRSQTSAFFGFEPGTEYTVLNAGVSYALSPTPIHTGDTFTLDILAENVFDMAGWQFDIAFDPAILEAIDVSEGDFLKTDGGTTFFHGGSIDNAAGKITGLNAARLSTQGVTGTGVLVRMRFRAKSKGETELALQKFQFGSTTGEAIPAGPQQIRVTVEGRLATGDVNRDGVVSILDLILVAQQLGRRVSAGSTVDVNRDGVVSILDLILVSQGIAGSPAAPVTPPLIPPQAGGAESVDAATIEAWIAQARLEDDGSLVFKQGIENLESLLASLIPEETALLANYPNPFNPETWIPYQLAESAEVMLTIYDMNGGVVRRLAVGHQAAGMYQSRSRAVYWDGRNQLGESVASGLYFYTLTAGDFTATRRMLILK